MPKRTIYIALIGLFVLAFFASRTPAQGAVLRDEEKIKATANTYSAANANVVVEMEDGRTFKGRIVSVGGDHFALNVTSANRIVDIRYGDVRRIKMQGMSKAAKTAIWVGVGAGIGALIIFGPRQRPLGTICPLGCGL